MARIIPLTDLTDPGLDVYARLTETQLRNRLEPEKGVFIAETEKVIRTALDKGASGLILVHNHPSGNPTPSPADVRQTEAVRKGVGAVGLTLLDHVVVADDSFFSFSDDRMYRNNAYLCESCTNTKKTPKP